MRKFSEKKNGNGRNIRLVLGQRDQIRQSFAFWAIVYFGQRFFKTTKENQILGLLFSTVEVMY
jgi:hypothetical protein